MFLRTRRNDLYQSQFYCTYCNKRGPPRLRRCICFPWKFQPFDFRPLPYKLWTEKIERLLGLLFVTLIGWVWQISEKKIFFVYFFCGCFFYCVSDSKKILSMVSFQCTCRLLSLNPMQISVTRSSSLVITTAVTKQPSTVCTFLYQIVCTSNFFCFVSYFFCNWCGISLAFCFTGWCAGFTSNLNMTFFIVRLVLYGQINCDNILCRSDWSVKLIHSLKFCIVQVNYRSRFVLNSSLITCLWVIRRNWCLLASTEFDPRIFTLFFSASWFLLFTGDRI